MQKTKQQTSESGSRFFRRVGSILPEKTIRSFEKKLKFVGNREDPRIWLGRSLFEGGIIGLILSVIYTIIFKPNFNLAIPSMICAGVFILGLIITLAIIYLRLFFKIADRASQVEKILPDFLSLIVSNLRAGMSPFAAFIHAARPEFGPLYEEIKLATARAGGRTSLPEALKEISQYFDSEVFSRTVDLFATGVKSGGQLVRLLNSNADEVRHIQDLRSELQTATRTYTIFLGFITVLIMPFLLAVSTQFVTIFLKFQNQSSSADAGVAAAGIPSFTGKILLSPSDMILISVATLLLTGLLVSALSGIISRGKALYGVKYFPIIAGAAIIFYLIAQTLLSSILTNF